MIKRFSMKKKRNPFMRIKDFFISRTMAVLGIVFAVLFVVAAGAAVHFYTQLAELKKDPQKEIQEEAQALVDKVGRLLVLPEGEQPTIATVSDVERLKDQPFFARAKNGDKVLIYQNAGKAILYDPVNDKIVEIAPVNIGSNPVPEELVPSEEETETETETETE